MSNTFTASATPDAYKGQVSPLAEPIDSPAKEKTISFWVGFIALWVVFWIGYGIGKFL